MHVTKLKAVINKILSLSMDPSHPSHRTEHVLFGEMIFGLRVCVFSHLLRTQKYSRSKKSNASKSHWELKNAQGDSEVDRSRSGMHFPVSLHFSGIPMDVVSHVGAPFFPFFRRNDIHGGASSTGIR